MSFNLTLHAYDEYADRNFDRGIEIPLFQVPTKQTLRILSSPEEERILLYTNWVKEKFKDEAQSHLELLTLQLIEMEARNKILVWDFI